MGVMVGGQEGSCHKDRGGFFPGPEVVSMIRFEPNDKNLIPHLRAPPTHPHLCQTHTTVCLHVLLETELRDFSNSSCAWVIQVRPGSHARTLCRGFVKHSSDLHLALLFAVASEVHTEALTLLIENYIPIPRNPSLW